MKLFQKEKRFYFSSMSSNKNSLCWTLYRHDPAMLHLMGFIIPLFCFVGKCFLIYVVFEMYVCGTNPTVLWRSVIGLIRETVLALAICKYSVAVIFILEVSWSKIKHRKSQLLGSVSLFVLLTCLEKGIHVTHSSKPQQAGVQRFWCEEMGTWDRGFPELFLVHPFC